MTGLSEILLMMAYIWLAINAVLIVYALSMRLFRKDKLPKRRKHALKVTIRTNFIYLIVALGLGFLLL